MTLCQLAPLPSEGTRLELADEPVRHTNAGRIAIPVLLTRGDAAEALTLVITADQAESLDSRLQALLGERSWAS